MSALDNTPFLPDSMSLDLCNNTSLVVLDMPGDAVLAAVELHSAELAFHWSVRVNDEVFVGLVVV